MPGNVTRTAWGSGDTENDDNYKKGDVEETTVNTAYLFFFEDDGAAWGTPRDIYAELTAAGGTGGAFSDPDGTKNTIDKLSKPIIMFENQDVPHSVVAVLNLTSEQATALGSMSLTDFRKALSANTIKWNTTGFGENAQGFIMSNSAYQTPSEGDTGAATEVYAQVLGDHLIEGEDANTSIENIRAQALANPLIIPVERTLARVHVDFEKTTGKNNTQYSYNGSIYVVENSAVVAKDVEIVSVVNGWWLHNTPTQSYLVKDLDNISNDENITDWNTWNDANNYRSYWAMPYAETDGENAQKYVAQYYSMNNMVDKYSFENTQQDNSKVELVVSANLWWKSAAEDETWERLDMIRWKQLNYTVEAFKQYVVERIKSELKIETFNSTNLVIKWNTSTEDQTLNEEAINDWQAVLTVNDFEDTENKIQTFLNEQIGAFMYYNQGKTYYHTPIVHNTLGEESNDKLYGVIRNHYYQIKVTGITGLGTPVPTPNPTDPNPTDPDEEPEKPENPQVPEEPEEPEDDPDNPITPGDPVDDQVSAIATEIAILKYRIVTQEAGLSGGATTPDQGNNE